VYLLTNFIKLQIKNIDKKQENDEKIKHFCHKLQHFWTPKNDTCEVNFTNICVFSYTQASVKQKLHAQKFFAEAGCSIYSSDAEA
jgi:hypothetical protein